jgi:phosphoglycerate dehydrogenase-like enzyme
VKKVAVLDDYLHLALKSADWSVLDGLCEIDVIDRKLQVPDEAAEVLAPYEVLCHLRERMPMPRSLLERLPRLEFMTVTGRAHRTLDLAAARAQGVLVSHVSAGETGSRSTPELAWGLILAVARHIAVEDRRVRQGVWQSTTGTLLAGKTLGLLGLGRTGQIMADIGRAFGMRVIAWSPNLTAQMAAQHGVTRVERDALFQGSDVLSVHVVLSERSHHLVGAREIALMRPEAILVNTARGAIVDEQALVGALQARRIGGAGLDVFETEPLPRDHPLLSLDNVVLSPHLGYATGDVFRGFYRATVAGVLAFLEGRPSNLLEASAAAT